MPAGRLRGRCGQHAAFDPPAALHFDAGGTVLGIAVVANRSRGNADLAGCTILIVEKEPLIALDAQVALEDAGGRVRVVGNVAAAVKVIEGGRLAGRARMGIELSPALKQKRVPYLFYATDAPDEVTQRCAVPRSC